MNRRQAIQQLTIMGLGLTLYPSCNTEKIPQYSRVPLDAKRYKLLQEVSEAILPVDHITYVTPEPRSQYILTILNDCTSTEEVTNFLTGLESLQQYLTGVKMSDLDKLSNDDLDKIFDYMADSKGQDENLYKFYRTTKNLATQHFTGCEKFMIEELKFEFVPGRYIGCKEV
ncbi:MAG: hypothetical protein KDC53_07985 [Saprospiraceae bacterium]|nr:hypothetical protein [Saprospiraceae bacterium]